MAPNEQYNPRLGVLGGMGPLATAVFYNRLVERSSDYATSDQDHIDTLILSDCQIPDRTEVMLNGDTKELLDRCAADFKILEFGGCEAICFPCNTLHHFIDQLEELTSLPIISMVESTMKHLKRNYPDVHTIQVFGTDGTRISGMYETAAAAHGLEVVPVKDAVQEEIMGFIYELKNTGREDFPLLSRRIMQAHRAGVDKVLLACTELSCMKLTPGAEPYAYDALDALVAECVEQFLPALQND